MKGRLGMAAAALVAAAAGGFAGPGTFGNPAGTFADSAKTNLNRPSPATLGAAQSAAMRRFLGRMTGSGGLGGAGGYLSREGWTNRRYKRAALKLRNQKRNRVAHR